VLFYSGNSQRDCDDRLGSCVRHNAQGEGTEVWTKEEEDVKRSRKKSHKKEKEGINFTCVQQGFRLLHARYQATKYEGTK